jgi:hypothetical protein
VLLFVFCLQAAQDVLVEHWSSGNDNDSSSSRLRQLTAADLLRAAEHVQPSVSKAQEYSQGLHGSASFDAGGSSSGAGLAGMAQIMAALAGAAAGRGSSSSRRSAAAGSNGSRKSSAAAAAAGGAGDVEEVEAGDADSEEARRDELYKMIGKMVMGSMSAGVLPQ